MTAQNALDLSPSQAPQAPQPTSVDKSDKAPVIRRLRSWLEPQAVDRDTAFRESTIRAAVAIIVVLGVLAFFTSRLVFGGEWTLISYSTLIVVWLALGVASAAAVTRHQIMLAGSLLVAAFMTAAVGVNLIDGYYTYLGLPVMALTILVSAVVLPRRAILSTAGIGILLWAVVAQAQYSFGAPIPLNLTWTPLQVLTNYVLFLLTECLFLLQLLREFDGRLADMRASKEQAERAREEADKANRAKSQFLANMSHELRTPLNAIIGYVEIMLSGMAGTFTEKQTQLHNHVHQNARRLLSLINDILDLAKIEAGRMDLRVAPMSPRKVIDEIVVGMESLALRKNIELKATYHQNTPEAVLADATKVQQIVTNLVGNAIKFTSEGGVEVGVSAGENSTWRIRVSDTGVGMPADAVNYIFEMFRQVDGTDTREHQGTGLGLAITKRLIDRMGGSITVETTLGRGSAFTVNLPRQMQETGA